MSDFTAPFWSLYVTIITLVGILGCLILLWMTGKKRVAASTDNTTGHVWDGDLREANNPLPMWWVGLFLITVVFGLAYLFLYPGLGSSKGSLGWSSHGQYDSEVDQANRELDPIYKGYLAKPVEQVARDPQAMAIGERLFMNNCSQCHGSDARGGKNFPNLTDNDWLYGGTPDKIIETITKGRIGEMPPMIAAVGTPDDARNLANYVLSLSGSPHDPLKASLGKPKFAVCAACHGPNGEGMQAVGAPNLTDKIWLHGYGVDMIMGAIQNGWHNQMPAQEGRLTEAQIKVLASYVWGLSNVQGASGKAAAAQ